MDHAGVQAWLDRYIAAWASYDPAAIGDLFSEDVEYRYYPHEEPVRGREAIVSSWLADQDAPGSWEAHYEPFVVSGDRAVATGTSSYDGGERTYHNCYLLEFDGDGRCRRFTEYYVLPNS